jgi:hypothetical protein
MSSRKNVDRYAPYTKAKPIRKTESPQVMRIPQQTQEQVLEEQLAAANRNLIAKMMEITPEQFEQLFQKYKPFVHTELAEIIAAESRICFGEVSHWGCPGREEFVGMYSTLASANSTIPDVPPPTDLSATFFPNGLSESYEFYTEDFELKWS